MPDGKSAMGRFTRSRSAQSPPGWVRHLTQDVQNHRGRFVIYNMDACIFDCDGVLVDSEKLSCGAWLPVLARRGIQAELADIEVFIGKSDAAVLEHFRKASGQPLDGDIIAEREAEFFALARQQLRGFDGLPHVLESLRQSHVQLAVASSGSPRKIRFSLELTGLDRYFPIVCSAAQVERGKPAPDLFLHAATLVGCEPDRCVVVEDSVPGLVGARAAGMRALGFTSSHPAPTLAAAGAQATFESYAGFAAAAARLTAG